MTEKEIDPIIVEFRETRKALKIAQNAAAEQMGIGATVLSGYENGRVSPQLDFVRTWAEWLGLGLILTDGEDEAPAASAAGSDDLVTVRLTRYQAALAMGVLGHANGQNRMAKDLQNIAELIGEALD